MSLAGLVLGVSYVVWACGALLLVCSSYGLGQRNDVEPVAHFGVPLSFSTIPSRRVAESGLPLTESPTILLQLSSVDWLGRHHIEGYGFASLPSKAGAMDIEVGIPSSFYYL